MNRTNSPIRLKDSFFDHFMYDTNLFKDIAYLNRIQEFDHSITVCLG